MLLRRLFGRDLQSRGVILGLDASGKTTLLYQMVLGKVITTIPTIGFNVEDVRRKEWTATLWDVGGCDKIRPLIEHYIDKDTFILFIHDCSDTQRLDESIDEMKFALQLMIRKKGTHFWVLLNKQDRLTAQESDNTVQDIKAGFQKAAEPYKHLCFIEVIGYSGLSGLTGHQTEAVFSRVKEVLLGQEHKPSKTVQDPRKTDAAAQALVPPTTEELVDSINKASQLADDVSTFWNAFLQADLQHWDHYTHLRAGYLVMLEALSAGSTILDSAEAFIVHLNRLRTARPDQFRNTAHRTMTVFWLLQLQRASLKYAIHQGSTGYSSADDFHQMLLHSPELMHSGLWRDFYSKGLLFTPDAKENWRLPDVKPLPAIAAVGRQQANSGPRNTDAGEDMLQFALAVIQATFPGKARRGAVIVRALPAFQSAIMRRRASNPNVPPFSETQVYFWIQYFHVAVVSLQENIPSSDSHQAMNTDWSAALSSLTLGTFKTLFGITGQEWKEHYSKAVWESVAARLEYTSPDLKRLPNVIKAPSERNVIEARGEILQSLREKALWGNSDGNGEFPSMVRLSVLVAAVLQEVSLLDDASMARPVASHAELLRELYRLLVRGRQQPGKKDDVQTGNTTDKTSRDEGTQGGLEAAMRLSGPGMQGVTQRMFWIQQFMSAQRKVGRAEAFAEFLDANPRLAFEGLPLVYYSVELWDSQDAITRFILPDRGTGEHPFY